MLPVVFSKLNGRIWQLKACYEILCVGKTSRTWKQMKHLIRLGKERGFLELPVSNVWGYSIILSTTVHSQVVISCQENILIFFRLFSALGSPKCMERLCFCLKYWLLNNSNKWFFTLCDPFWQSAMDLFSEKHVVTQFPHLSCTVRHSLLFLLILLFYIQM